MKSKNRKRLCRGGDGNVTEGMQSYQVPTKTVHFGLEYITLAIE